MYTRLFLAVAIAYLVFLDFKIDACYESSSNEEKEEDEGHLSYLHVEDPVDKLVKSTVQTNVASLQSLNSTEQVQ